MYPIKLFIRICVLLAILSHCYAQTSTADSISGLTRSEIDKLLSNRVTTVVHKATFPPAIDPNNYVSYASYWWPNPKTPDGFPYIRKDGKRNEALVKQGDASNFEHMAKSVVLLTRAYKQWNDPKYAKKAAEYLTAWFINPKTMMNPNLNNGQMIMGKNDGTKSGILETRYNISILEVEPWLVGSEQWSDDDHKKFQNWFTKYYAWLIGSKIGIDAGTKFDNNHGSWYDAQVSAIAIYLGRKDFAKQVIENAKSRRIAVQIMPDGKQPQELERTRSLMYSLFNIEALTALSAQADKLGIDLWNYSTADGRSLTKAYAFVAPYKNNKAGWRGQQIDEVEDWRWEVIENRKEILLNIFR